MSKQCLLRLNEWQAVCFLIPEGSSLAAVLVTDWLAGVMLAGRRVAVIGSLACSADWPTAGGTQQQQLKNYNGPMPGST